jgi:hypothetical protein
MALHTLHDSTLVCMAPVSVYSFLLSAPPSLPPNKFVFQNDVAKLGDVVLIPSWASIIITRHN